jgi:flagellar hook-associated protein 1 FlgK
MSLFSSIHMASNTLRANQIAMQVVGQNIANANTPGYIREDVIFTPGPTQQVGGLLLGSGVSVTAVIQRIDVFLEDRLRGSVSDRASSDTQEEIYLQLEGLIGELTETDLSTSMNKFFSSISEVLNQPESASVRNLVVLQGTTLAGDINRLADKVFQLRSDVDDRVRGAGVRINQLLEEVRVLNVRIAQTEGGDISSSDAVGLRDQRLVAIEELASLINVRVEEQPSGGVTIYAGGEYLLHESVVRPVKVALQNDRGLTVAEIRLAETDSPLQATSGELFGLTAARDDVLAAFQEQLDDFARTLAFEFNKVYSGGQGLNGFRELTSEWGVDASNVPLDRAGLPFTPVNGSFQLIVNNTRTGIAHTTDVQVDLNHLGKDTTLDDLAAALDAVDGISAEVLASGKLTISSDSADNDFAFADDTSGILAALGLNVFFTGSTASSLGTSGVLKKDPAKFAASRGGVGADVDNAVVLAEFLDQPLASKSGASIGTLYDRLVSDTTQGSTVSRAVAEGNRAFEQTLRSQKIATSGVSLDEETVRLIGYQQSYQASARYISVLRELFQILVTV